MLDTFPAAAKTGEAPVLGQGECQLSVAWKESEPYAYTAHWSGLLGLDIRIAEMIVQAAGCQAKFIRAPVATAGEAFGKLNADIYVTTDPNPQAVPGMVFSEPYRHESIAALTRAGAAIGYRGGDVVSSIRNGTSVAVPRSVGIPDSLLPIMNDPVLKYRLKMVRTEKDALTLLLHSVVEMALCPESRVSVHFKRHERFRRSFVLAPISSLTRSVHLLLHHRAAEPSMVQRINSAIVSEEIKRKISDLRSSFANASPIKRLPKRNLSHK